MKSLHTLPEDITKLLTEGVENLNEENLAKFTEDLARLLRLRLKQKSKEPVKKTLRMSKLGTPDRKLWFEFNVQTTVEVTHPLKFLYGDIIELLVLYLAKETGHTIFNEQKTHEIDGVIGHQDCGMDEYQIVDVKSASNFSYKKFAERTLFRNDPFGYVAQLSSYMKAEGTDKGAFVAVNKETGEVCVMEVGPSDTIDPEKRIQDIREMLKSSTPPKDLCYEPVEFGKSGNTQINPSCYYCPFKDLCWAGKTRKFKYATGIVELVDVKNLPKVEEVY